MLPLCSDLRQVGWGSGRRLRAELLGNPTVAAVEVLHCEVNTIEFAAGNVQVARYPRADCQHDCVEITLQLISADVDPHIDAVAELNAFIDQLLDATVDHVLLDLEVRHAEADQAARRFVALEDDNLVPRTA
ncbi:unannotated protein [freshwater metagenome]|uniref:Unannotated protein n=1 Tax=freshwater metagenome TaxID=449393 RepID=A0A6J7S776_9ZZZZ